MTRFRHKAGLARIVLRDIVFICLCVCVCLMLQVREKAELEEPPWGKKQDKKTARPSQAGGRTSR